MLFKTRRTLAQKWALDLEHQAPDRSSPTPWEQDADFAPGAYSGPGERCAVCGAEVGGISAYWRDGRVLCREHWGGGEAKRSTTGN